MDQISIFDTACFDETYDKRGRKQTIPYWYEYKRCENCTRWQKLDMSEQPPDGWGIKGLCRAHYNRVNKTDRCAEWEDKRKV